MEPLAVSPDLLAFVRRLGSGPDADPGDANPGDLGGVDARGGADLFAEEFLSLDPARSMVMTREQLRAALPKRRALFAAAGIRRTRLESLDVHALDDGHQLAQTTWAAEFDDPLTEPIALRSTFLLRRAGDAWHVVVYLNHDDIGATLARRAAG